MERTSCLLILPMPKEREPAVFAFHGNLRQGGGSRSIHREPVAHEGKKKEKAELQTPEPHLPKTAVAEGAEDHGPEHDLV